MYHQKKILLPMLATLLFTGGQSVFANQHCDPQEASRFLILGTGISFSQKANIAVNTDFWDPANEGYNARLHNSEQYTGGLGYRFTTLLSGSLEAGHRPSFRYSKFQTVVPGSATPGILGSKTRKFRLSNTTIMANIILNGAGVDLQANFCAFKIQPFAGAGLGIAYNKMFDFHSVRTVSTAGFNNVASIMNEQVTKSFAWQLILGAAFELTQKFGLDIGYRYLDSGRFKSNDYFTDVPIGGTFTQPTAVPSWKGKLKAQEIFLNLKYSF